MDVSGVENLSGWFLVFFCFGFIWGLYYFTILRQPPRPLDLSVWGEKLGRLVGKFRRQPVDPDELESLNLSKEDIESGETSMTRFDD